MRMRNATAAMTLAMAMSACSSADDATTGNFQRVIDEHYARKCILIRPNGGIGVDTRQYPVTAELVPSDRPGASERNQRTIREFEALVAAGLLRVEDATVESSFGRKAQVPARRYHLTPLGEKNYQTQERFPGFCVGHYEVDAIKRFSEPGTLGPYTMSEVVYSYSPHDVPDWARDAKVQDAMPRLAQALEPNQSGKVTLVKTNNGWVREQDFRD